MPIHKSYQQTNKPTNQQTNKPTKSRKTTKLGGALRKPIYPKNEVMYRLYALAEIVGSTLKKFSINYRADAGTLLGIIRHNGNAIPWDDDVDLIVNECDIDKIIGISHEFNKRGVMMSVKYDEPLKPEDINTDKRLQLSFISDCNDIETEREKRKCVIEGVTIPFLDIIPVKLDTDSDLYKYSIDWMLKEKLTEKVRFTKVFFSPENSVEAKFGPTTLIISQNSEANKNALITMYGENFAKIAKPPVVQHTTQQIVFDDIPLDQPDVYDYSELNSDNLTPEQHIKYNELIKITNGKIKEPYVIRWYLDNKEFGFPIFSKTKYITKEQCVTGGKPLIKSLDKCTVEELKARSAKRGIKVTGLKKAEILTKLRK